MTSLREQLQTASDQVAQLTAEVQALNQKSTELQEDLAHAEHSQTLLHQQLEVRPSAAEVLCALLLSSPTSPHSHTAMTHNGALVCITSCGMFATGRQFAVVTPDV